MSILKTRFAPTPSGYLHIGNAYSFVLTVLLAKQEGANILLRIDDLDRSRYRRKYVDDVFRTLEFLELYWDEGPRSTSEFEKEWSQQHRMPLYRNALEALRQKDLLFGCTCSRKELNRLSSDGGYIGKCRKRPVTEGEAEAWRIATDDGVLQYKLWPQGVENAPLPVGMRDFVVRRKDHVPAYQLASVVDDLHFDVNVIARGADLVESSLAQLFLAQRLGEPRFAEARFFHHTLITDKKGGKLSKSKGSGSLRHFIKNGGTREELYRRISEVMGLKESFASFAELAEGVGAKTLELQGNRF